MSPRRRWRRRIPWKPLSFPTSRASIKGAAPQKMGFAKDGLVLRLTPGDKVAAMAARLHGVLVLTSTDGSIQALNVDAPPGPVPDAADFGESGAAAATSRLWLALSFRLSGRADPQCHALCAADPGDEGAGAGGPWRPQHREAAREGFAYSAGRDR